MLRFGPLLAAVALLVVGPAALLGQEPATPIVDTILVEGNARLTQSQIVGTAGLVAHQPINYRDVQRAIGNLFRTGQFDDVLVEQRTAGDRLLLVFKVKERPVLERWAVRGVQRLGEGSVKGRVKLTEGRPLDRNAGDASRERILPDNIYDAVRPFRESTLVSEIMGPEVHQKYVELKLAAADRCPRALGTRIKRSEIIFHHEVTNQFLWNRF